MFFLHDHGTIIMEIIYLLSLHLTIMHLRMYIFDIYLPLSILSTYLQVAQQEKTSSKKTLEPPVWSTSVPWSTKPDNTDSLVDAEIKRSMRLLGTNCRSLGGVLWEGSKSNILNPFVKSSNRDMQDVYNCYLDIDNLTAIFSHPRLLVVCIISLHVTNCCKPIVFSASRSCNDQVSGDPWYNVLSVDWIRVDYTVATVGATALPSQLWLLCTAAQKLFAFPRLTLPSSSSQTPHSWSGHHLTLALPHYTKLLHLPIRLQTLERQKQHANIAN